MNSRLESVLNKYRSFDETSESSVSLDYSVTKENGSVQFSNKILEKAIFHSLQVQFDYRNSEGTASRKVVCPLALRYKWYAWYLFAFDTAEKELAPPLPFELRIMFNKTTPSPPEA